MRVTEQLYIYLWGNPRENNCNTVFIDGKVPMLIDPGHWKHLDNLFERMAADGVDPGKIRVVLCTHGHPDHFEGTAYFQDKTVKIAASQQEETFIQTAGPGMYSAHGANMPEFRVDLWLKDGDLTLGRHEFEILLTPGHSPGGLCIYWPRFKVLVSGDVVFSQGIGRVDLPGGDINVLKKSVERLSQLSVELLIPGHGSAVQGAESVQANFAYIKKAFFRMG